MNKYIRSLLKMKSNGFTLIELIIYVALIAIFISGSILFAWNAIYAGESNIQQQAVEQNARVALARITYEISRAQGINSFSATSITLENGANDTTIALNTGVIEITTGGAGPYALTSNQVFVSDLTFSQPGSSDENTNNITVSLSVRQANSSSSNTLEAETTMSGTTEVSGQFNQSRQFLIDLSGGDLTPNRRTIEGITIENTGSSTLTIDQVEVSWSNTVGGENITGIEIDGGSVWSGSSGTGSTLDIANFALTVASGVTPIDAIDFDSTMDNATFNFNLIFTDGSVHKSTISFGAASPTPSPTPSVTPTPSPSPSPSPVINTCAAYCVTQAYSGGTCRANVNRCNQNGETNLPLGDVFCTGGNNADTCCCAP